MAVELRQKIGQLFMVSFAGVEPSEEFQRFVETASVGSVCLFAGNCPSIKKVHTSIQQLKSLPHTQPLCIAIDHEGGRVHRLPKPATHFPPMATLGRLYERMPSSRLAWEVGRVMAKELKELGVNLDFAPVADVNTNPLNPVIGDRSFSNRPEVVAVAASQLIQGLQENGIAACAKHFPGHGDTNEDSHLLLPRLPHNFRRLEAIELAPFRVAISQNVAAIMTAHVVYNGMDHGLPATFSVKLLRDFLREEMKFEGLIVTDDLNMGAVRHHWSLEDAVVKAFLAGCDLLLVLGCSVAKTKAVVDHFYRAVVEKTIPMERVEESFARISLFKKKYCLRSGGYVPDLGVIGCQDHQNLLKQINQLV